MRRVSAVLLFVLVARLAIAAAPSPFVYTVRPLAPNTHLLSVMIEVPDVHADTLEFAMPAWTPGAYDIQDFGRNVEGFAATDGRGHTLASRRIDKQTWRVWSRGADRVVATYRVYVNQMSIVTSQYNDVHCWINGASVYMYVVGQIKHAIELRLEGFPSNWRTATALDPGPGAWKFTSPDYDYLVDCPIDIADHKVMQFESDGKTHYIVTHTDAKYDPGQLTTFVKRIADQEIALFGHAPYPRYVFFIHTGSGGGGGGLEHLASTALGTNPEFARSDETLRRFAGLVAHEFFHLWNVKRIRPLPLGPFDYTREVITPYLWESEGWTSYFGDLSVRRAGITTKQQYYDSMARLMQSYDENPAAKVVSAADASITTWINPDKPFSTISYYGKGQLLAFCLDLEMRGRTQNAKSLDDLMRYLYDEYAAKGVGYPDGAVQKAAEVLTGTSFQDFFDKYVFAPTRPPYDDFLKHAGLRLNITTTESGPTLNIRTGAGFGGGGGPGPFAAGAAVAGALAAQAAASVDLLTVQSCLPGGAGDKAGIDQGDIIVAIDGRRARASTFDQVLRDYFTTGQEVTLTVIRGDRLLTLKATLDSNKTSQYSLAEIENPTDLQVKIRETYLGIAH